MNYTMLWLIIGIVLLVAEMLSGTFVIIFFSIGSFISALIALVAPDLLSAQILVNAFVSLGGAFLLKKPLQNKLLKANSIHADLGKELTVDQEILSNQQSRISYQGTTWQATNVGSETINKGDRAIVVGMDNLTLLLKKN